MTLPIEGFNIESGAAMAISALKQVKFKAQDATALKHRRIANLYYQIIKSDVLVSALILQFGGAALGAAIGDHLGVEWSTVSGDFVALKNTHMPAFNSYVSSNVSDIFQAELGVSDLQFASIPAANATQLQTLIQNIIDQFTV